MYLYGFDSGYLLYVLPALLFALWAQSRVSAAFNRYSRMRNARNMTGADVARRLLDDSGLGDVRVAPTSGRLSDHYDPRDRTLYLSAEVYHQPSIAAVGIAAHEVGHAVQHGIGYAPLALRNGLVPIAQIGSTLAFPLFFLGFFMRAGFLMNLGLLVFAGALVFQVITLPVEFNASSRAVELLSERGYLGGEEMSGARAVLSAAALTYIAATAMALAQMLRLMALARRRD